MATQNHLRRVLTAVRRRLDRNAIQPIAIPAEVIADVVARNGAEPWHAWAMSNLKSRPETSGLLRWIRSNVSKEKHIFETACGACSNLIWLGERGYRKLSGADLSAGAVAAGREFARYVNLPIDVWQDNSLSPAKVPDCDVILAMSWTYLRNVPFDFPAFLDRYGAALPAGGLILTDVVDRSFNAVPDNEYQTDDWHLPAAERRPTQYKLRMSEDEVRSISGRHGFEVIEFRPATELPPRRLYVLRRNGGDSL